MSAKRILTILLFAVCLFGTCVIAYAAEPLSVSCAFTPADFVEPGNAKLSVTIHNSSDKLIESVRFSQDANKDGEKVGSIEPGETMHFSLDVQITKKMLDAGKATFTLTYKIGNKQQKMQTSATVTHVANLASVTLTSRIFKTALYSGESTQAEYRLVNSGTIAVENAVVTDQAFGFTSSPVTLAPGEEQVFYAACAFSQSAISSPRVDFISSESKNPYVTHASSVALHVTEDNFSFIIEPETVSVGYGGRAHFSVAINNNSLLSYTDLSVAIENLGVFPIESAYLKPGESLRFQVETPPVSASGVYPIQVNMCESGGSERSFYAGEMHVSVSESAFRSPLIHVSANPSGPSPFTFTISGANRDLKNVLLSEKNLGDIKTFLVIKADAETVYSPLLHVDKGEPFEFMLSWEEGAETFTVSATPVISQFASSKDAEASLIDASHASLYAMVNATRLPKIVLTASFLVLFIALSAFIIYKTVQAKKRRRQARAQLGKTNKFAPIRTRDTEKEQ